MKAGTTILEILNANLVLSVIIASMLRRLLALLENMLTFCLQLFALNAHKTTFALLKLQFKLALGHNGQLPDQHHATLAQPATLAQSAT